MAKKIKTQEVESEATSEAAPETVMEETPSENMEISTEQVEEVAETLAEQSADEDKTKSTKKKAKKDDSIIAQEPDDDIKRVLKSFPTYEYLYVNKQGGVFAPDTKPTLVGGAILYKNPFFNK